ncbi:hypothetical protein [uncultured Brevundimonas sp.]|uniref:hypothetical protein n=1 Tax=uncultured Brevundimonas sp. TaxID=213418 RepID=UPI00262732FC|nr:hypothetical protein [uncultured Brevundimonas sp.]
MKSTAAMTTPQRIVDLIRASAPQNINERPGHLVLHTQLHDNEIRECWLSLRSEPPAFIDGIAITEADGDTELSADDPPEPDAHYRITVRTSLVANQLRLFLSSSLTKEIALLADVNIVLIADMQPDEVFATRRARFQPWTNEEPEPFAPSEPSHDPRTYCSDFTGLHHTPSDIRPWLLRSMPTRKGETWSTWQLASSRKLIAAIADRVSNGDHDPLYHFNGPPACSLSLSDAEITSLHSDLHEAASWVYNENRDVDTRHMFMAAEWARTYRSGNVSDFGKGSIASATAAWAAHAKSGSKETLKALTDLRKAVADEGQKAVQRAHDLAGAMWKDVAIASAPFVIKVLSDTSKIESYLLSGILSACAGIFLCLSFGIQIYINRNYFISQDEARKNWKKSLVALTPGEIDELSETPINKGVSTYKKVRNTIAIAYLIIVLSLFTYSYTNFKNMQNIEQRSTVSKIEAPLGSGNANQANTPSQDPTAATSKGPQMEILQPHADPGPALSNTRTITPPEQNAAAESDARNEK